MKTIKLSEDRTVTNHPKTKKEKIKEFFAEISDSLSDFWQSACEFYVGLGKGILSFLTILGMGLYIAVKFLLIIAFIFAPAAISLILVHAFGLTPLWYLLNVIYLVLLPVVYHIFNK